MTRYSDYSRSGGFCSSQSDFSPESVVPWQVRAVVPQVHRGSGVVPVVEPDLVPSPLSGLYVHPSVLRVLAVHLEVAVEARRTRCGPQSSEWSVCPPFGPQGPRCPPGGDGGGYSRGSVGAGGPGQGEQEREEVVVRLRERERVMGGIQCASPACRLLILSDPATPGQV